MARKRLIVVWLRAISDRAPVMKHYGVGAKRHGLSTANEKFVVEKARHDLPQRWWRNDRVYVLTKRKRVSTASVHGSWIDGLAPTRRFVSSPTVDGCLPLLAAAYPTTVEASA